MVGARKSRLWVLALTLASIAYLQPAHAFTGSTYTDVSTVYVVNQFNADESWIVPFGVTSIDAIAVGGGGGGGTDGGDGGGGGELRILTNQLVSAGNVLSTVIGSGGAGAVWATSNSGSGGTTYLRRDGNNLLVANGGAGGNGWTTTQNTAAGGSGGSGGTGFNGGNGGLNRYQQNEGIGGAGSAGPTTTITTGSALNYGGGGGGGSCWNAKSSGTFAGAAGGAGGGGAGAGHTQNVGSPAGSAGTANTGGGGGGGSACDGGTTNKVDQRTSGGAGGSGVVVIRYVLTSPTSLDLDTSSDLGSSSTDNITSDPTLTITGSAIGGTTIQLMVDGVASGSTCLANSSTGSWSCTTASLTSGIKSIVARSSISGAVKSSSALSVTVDTAAPVLSPSTSISQSENQTSITTVSCNETCALAMTGGADSSTVTFNTGTGVLVFKVAPDFESPTDADLNRTYLISITATDTSGNTTVGNFVVTITNLNEASTLGSLTLSGQAFKGITQSLSITTNVAGKVRFFLNGKRIANCVSISTTGSYPNFTATCPWKPTVTARQALSASFSPTDTSFSAASSSTLSVWVYKRTTRR